MVQEAPSPRLVRLERRLANLERLLKLGLVGGDVEDIQSQLNRQQNLLSALIGDRTLGNTLLGPFPSGLSSVSLRRTDGHLYSGGSISTLDATTVVGIFDGDIVAIPFYLPAMPNLVDEIVIKVTTAEVGKNARMGVYADDGSLYPGRRLLDAGEVSIGTTGLKKLSVDESLPRGLVWLALHANPTSQVTVVFTAYKASVDKGAWVILGQDPSLLIPYVGWRVSSTYGPLPAVYPAGATRQQTSPVVWLSFKDGGWS